MAGVRVHRIACCHCYLSRLRRQQGQHREYCCGVFTPPPPPVAQVHPRALPNLPDGTLDLATVAAAVRPSNEHFPVSRLLCLENTHNKCGGRVLPVDYMDRWAASGQGSSQPSSAHLSLSHRKTSTRMRCWDAWAHVALA